MLKKLFPRRPPDDDPALAADMLRGLGPEKAAQAVALYLRGIAGQQGEAAFSDGLFGAMHDPIGERNAFYHLEERMLLALLGELRLTQGASVRTVNITDQYVQAALRHFPSLKGRHVVEIGPGRNLGAGIAFRYLGADRYTGIELHVGADFNTRSTLATIEALVRLKYGSFVSNFNAEALGFVGDGALADNVSLENSGISLMQPQALSTLGLPDESADLVYSNFTFEHIQRPDEMIAEISRVLKPGGITAHFIDPEDHADFNKPFAYLVHSDAEWEARYGEGKVPLWLYENRLRASDFRRCFSQHGLRVVEYTPLRSAELPPELWEKLAPRFREYDLDDLRVVWLFLVAVKD